MLSTLTLGAQTTPEDLKNKRVPYFERKFVAGFSFNNSWSSYYDLLPDSAFYKPSIGAGLRAEYFFKPFIGISVGAGIQQRGMGVYTPDLDNTVSIGNEDSTGRLRYRTTTYDFPVLLVLRYPKDIFKSGRLSLMAGVDFSVINKAHRIWRSVDDGFHELTDITSGFTKVDMPLRAGLGLDIEAASGCLFRVNLFGELGRKKIYTDNASGQNWGQNVLIGIDLSCLF